MNDADQALHERQREGEQEQKLEQAHVQDRNWVERERGKLVMLLMYDSLWRWTSRGLEKPKESSKRATKPTDRSAGEVQQVERTVEHLVRGAHEE